VKISVSGEKFVEPKLPDNFSNMNLGNTYNDFGLAGSLKMTPISSLPLPLI